MFEHLFTQRIAGRNQEERGTDRPIKGKILHGTEDPTVELFVLVDDIDENARRGPCSWSPISHGPITYYPSGGEDCTIQFDSQGLPWINWTPDASSHALYSVKHKRLPEAGMPELKAKESHVINVEWDVPFQDNNYSVSVLVINTNAWVQANLEGYLPSGKGVKIVLTNLDPVNTHEPEGIQVIGVHD